MQIFELGDTTYETPEFPVKYLDSFLAWFDKEINTDREAHHVPEEYTCYVVLFDIEYDEEIRKICDRLEQCYDRS